MSKLPTEHRSGDLALRGHTDRPDSVPGQHRERGAKDLQVLPAVHQPKAETRDDLLGYSEGIIHLR